MNNSTIISVTSVKGGTGKTTTVLSLAGIYSLQKKRVLIIDMDLYSSSVVTMLNLDSNTDIYKMVDDLGNNRFQALEDYITKYNDYIDVIPAPKDPRFSSKVNSKYLSMMLLKAKFNYDVILIDTNHFMNDVNLTLFDCSDKILYVITNDPVDLKNMRTIVDIYKDIDKINYRILLNSSIDKNRNYFSRYDIKNFLKYDVDFHITSEFYNKKIDKYIVDGKILTLDKKVRMLCKNSIKTYEYMAMKLLEGKEEVK